MSSNKGNRFGGKGYYIALILCAAAIGITSYVYRRNAQTVEQAVLEESWEDVPVGTLGTEDVAVIATQPVPKPSDKPAETTAAAPAEKKSLRTVSPVSGAEIFGYSMEALSYNQTTRDWRVHDGIDLAAEAGAEVLAAADGEVYTVGQDDALGYTVVIRHDDGYTTSYSCLGEDLAVKPGDKVTAGQTIGYAGDSAIVESALGTHVHFSVTRYDQSMDPAAFLALGQ